MLSYFVGELCGFACVRACIANYTTFIFRLNYTTILIYFLFFHYVKKKKKIKCNQIQLNKTEFFFAKSYRETVGRVQYVFLIHHSPRILLLKKTRETRNNVENVVFYYSTHWPVKQIDQHLFAQIPVDLPSGESTSRIINEF